MLTYTLVVYYSLQNPRIGPSWQFASEYDRVVQFCILAGQWRKKRGGQNFSEGCKKILVTSNRCRIITDVGHDDFMQCERSLGVARVPSRLAATLVASPSNAVCPGANLADSGIASRTEIPT